MLNHSLLNMLSNKVVLYAEDETGIRDVVTEILELFFHKVIAVQDGVEALEQFEITPPDVLIFDICLPRTDGLSVIQTIRKRHKHIPVIVLSAHREQKYLWRAVELKITKYLLKPFKKEELEEALCLCCDELSQYKQCSAIGQSIYYTDKKVLVSPAQEYKLSKSESRLLEYFLEHQKQVLSFEVIDEYLWGYDGLPHSKEAIKSLVKDLRKKVGKEYIQNSYGIGYYFEI